MKKPLKYYQLKVGMKVIDSYGEKGVIEKVENEHNIWVDITNEWGKGNGVYCVDNNCCEYEKLYKAGFGNPFLKSFQLMKNLLIKTLECIASIIVVIISALLFGLGFMKDDFKNYD